MGREPSIKCLLGERVVECVADFRRPEKTGGFGLFHPLLHIVLAETHNRHQVVEAEHLSEDARLFEGLAGFWSQARYPFKDRLAHALGHCEVMHVLA